MDPIAGQLVALVHSDEISPMEALRLLRPPPGELLAAEAVVSDPEAAARDALGALADLARDLWPDWYGPNDWAAGGLEPEEGLELDKGLGPAKGVGPPGHDAQSRDSRVHASRGHDAQNHGAHGHDTHGHDTRDHDTHDHDARDHHASFFDDLIREPGPSWPGKIFRESLVADPRSHIPSGLNRHWLARASMAARRGRSPFFIEMALETQARQLALAVSGQVSSIHLAADLEESRKEAGFPGSWARFGKRLEALGGNTGLGVLFLAPESLFKAMGWDDFPGRIMRMDLAASLARGEPLGSGEGLAEGASSRGAKGRALGASSGAACPDAKALASPKAGAFSKNAAYLKALEAAVKTGASAWAGASEVSAKSGPALGPALGFEDAPKVLFFEIDPAKLLAEPFAEPIAKPLGDPGPKTSSEPQAAPSIPPWPGSEAGSREAPLVSDSFPKPGEIHPLSPAEKILAEALGRDPDLKGLFQSNIPLTALGTRLLVDFFWKEGALAVEVDGFKFHKHFAAFESDRERDWKLLATGRRVLRLTAWEVLRDVEHALWKIRLVVRHI